MTRLAPLLLIAFALLAAPAHAAESFVGVTADGEVVRYLDQAPTGLSTPARMSGLLAGDRIVALAPNHALGRSGTLYVLNTRTRRVTPTAARVPISGRSFSLLVYDARRARVLTSTGQDFLIDMADFTVTPGPGLRTASGAAVRPAATLLSDGRVAGVDPTRGTLVTETEPGSNVVTEIRVTNAREERLELANPLSFSVASGRGYLLSLLPPTARRRQSRLIRIDLATGRTTGEGGPFFFREIVSGVPLGRVADDVRPPRVRWIDPPARISLRALERDGGVRFRIRVDEAAQTLVATGVGGRSNAAVLYSRDTPGTISVRLRRHDRREIRQLRFRLGKTIKLRVFVRDWANNNRSYDRDVRLVP